MNLVKNHFSIGISFFPIYSDIGLTAHHISSLLLGHLFFSGEPPTSPPLRFREAQTAMQSGSIRLSLSLPTSHPAAFTIPKEG